MANKDLIPAKDEEFNSFQSNLVTLVTENAVFTFTEAMGINVFQSVIRVFYPKHKLARG